MQADSQEKKDGEESPFPEPYRMRANPMNLNNSFDEETVGVVGNDEARRSFA